jgi:hypothetical protein
MANYIQTNWQNNSETIVPWVNSLGAYVGWLSNNQVSATDFTWTQTLLSQYVDSPTINSLLSSYNDAVEPSVDILNFYNNIWNVATAVGNGLDIWGQIVGVSRLLNTNTSGYYFGFEEAASGTTGSQPFNQAPFYVGKTSTTTYALTDSQYRRLILVKAGFNISNNTAPSINALLRAEFSTPPEGTNDPYGQAWVIDNLNMSFTYHLDFTPNAVQLAIITNSGVFPRPAGVQLILTHL